MTAGVTPHNGAKPSADAAQPTQGKAAWAVSTMMLWNGDARGVVPLATLRYSAGVDREQIRAAAERMYAHGIQGVLLWNLFYEMGYYRAS